MHGLIKQLAAGVCLALAVGRGGVEPASADPRPLSPVLAPTATPKDPEEQTLSVLETHCARCHEASRAADRASTPAPQNILALDVLARDPGFVVPGRPDASRLYQRLLGRHRPASVYATPGSEPAPADIDAVRAWIASLPRPEDLCADRIRTGWQEAEAAMARWREAAKGHRVRFLSLVHLANACEPENAIAAARAAAMVLLDGLGRHDMPPTVETVGEANAVLAVSLDVVGLTEDAWQRLAEGAPKAPGDAIPADWLGQRLLTPIRGPGGAIAPELDITRAPEARAAAEMLAGLWGRDIDLARAAAELGLTPETLRDKLYAITGADEIDARRLIQSPVSRQAWTRLAAALAADPAPATPAPPLAGAPARAETIDLALWSEAPSYRVGDVLRLNVMASAACQLTLVSVDPSGHALILFPNDLEPDNTIGPRAVVRFPAAATYDIRFDKPGEETIVAVCRRTARTLDGVAFDYEKQRFAVLGDWRGFLLESAAAAIETAKAGAARDAAETSRDRASRHRGSGHAGPSLDLAPLDPKGPDVEGRAAITLPIAPKS